MSGVALDPSLASPGLDQTQLVHTAWIQSVWCELPYRRNRYQGVRGQPLALRLMVKQQNGVYAVLTRKYRRITLSRRCAVSALVGYSPKGREVESTDLLLGQWLT